MSQLLKPDPDFYYQLCNEQRLIDTIGNGKINHGIERNQIFALVLNEVSEYTVNCKNSHVKIPLAYIGKYIRTAVNRLSDEELGNAFKIIGCHQRKTTAWNQYP